MSGGLLGNFGRLAMAGVVLPQPGVGRQVLGQLRIHAQWQSPAIDGNRRRAGGVDADADDALGLETGLSLGRPKGPAHRAIETLDVVGRVLPGEVGVFRIGEDSGLAAGIVKHGGGHFAAVGQIDHQSPHAIGAVIDADGILLL